MSKKYQIIPIFDSIEYIADQKDFSYLSDDYTIFSNSKLINKFVKFFFINISL
jgi:hypothetical protein